MESTTKAFPSIVSLEDGHRRKINLVCVAVNETHVLVHVMIAGKAEDQMTAFVSKGTGYFLLMEEGVYFGNITGTKERS